MGRICKEVLCFMCMSGNNLKEIKNGAVCSIWPASGYCSARLLLLEMHGQGMFSQKSSCSAAKAAGILSAVRIQTALRQV